MLFFFFDLVVGFFVIFWFYYWIWFVFGYVFDMCIDGVGNEWVW